MKPHKLNNKRYFTGNIEKEEIDEKRFKKRF